jgi:ribosomal protein S18 acetylase RimI-like enzyme
MHEKFFPVNYSDQFYESSCKGIGIRGLPLYSIIATRDDKIVGFLLSQFLPLSQAEDREALDISYYGPDADEVQAPEAMYILTLGCTPELRHLGLASKMVNMCVLHSKNNPRCGAVYLHVLVSNTAAIHFYEKNHFTFYRTRYNYYEFDDKMHTAYLYLLPMNNFAVNQSFYHKFWMLADVVLRTFSNITQRWGGYHPHEGLKIKDLPPPSYDYV